MLTARRLRQLLDYDYETGVFRWKFDRGGKAKRGSVAGALRKNGYREIAIEGRRYRAARLAWLYVYGHWPTTKKVDHRNNVRDDDRLFNLREATDAESAQNRRRSDSLLGLKGAYRYRKKWMSKIRVDRRQIYLGLFNSAEEAHAAYCAAAIEHFGAFARFA